MAIVSFLHVTYEFTRLCNLLFSVATLWLTVLQIDLLHSMSCSQNKRFSPDDITDTCTYVRFAHMNLPKIPSFVFSHLSKCWYMTFYNTKTSNIELHAWYGLLQLRTLDIRRSDTLTVLTDNMFQHLISLQRLYLRYNLISVIMSSEVWNGLESLTYLSLYRNKITVLKTNMFSNLFSLKDLSLRDNLITKIEKDSFSILFNLTTLRLQTNMIASIESGAWNGLHSLPSLDLNKQKITVITTAMFEELQSLEELSIRENQISIVEVNAFISLRSLNKLHLGRNEITVIVFGAWNGLNDTLTHLDLGHNYLTYLYRNMFSQLSVLQELKLQYNRIEAIESEAFAGLRSIQSLWLINNKLETLEFKTFNPRDFNNTGRHPGKVFINLILITMKSF